MRPLNVLFDPIAGIGRCHRCQEASTEERCHPPFSSVSGLDIKILSIGCVQGLTESERSQDRRCQICCLCGSKLTNMLADWLSFFWGALSVASYAEPWLVVDEQAASGGTAGYGSTTDIVIGLH